MRGLQIAYEMQMCKSAVHTIFAICHKQMLLRLAKQPGSTLANAQSSNDLSVQQHVVQKLD